MRSETLIGQKFGRLTVLLRSKDKINGAVQQSMWLCVCECRRHAIVRGNHLRTRKTNSCGCLHRKHGMRHSPEYNTWCAMIQRCHNPNHPRYEDYGGRGITVCDRWITSFSDFFADVGLRPTQFHSLDRENNNIGYEPGNCRWATAKEQGRNMRSNRWLSVNGKSKLIAEWAEINGPHEETIRKRLNRGMSEQDAVLAPSRQKARRQP